MRIGLIVPVRPPAPFVDEALASALEQERPPERHVVVEDAEGAGPAAARQRGLEQLEDCDWIALLDADDAWEPGKLAAQRAAVAASPDAVVCFGRATAVDEGGETTGERLPELAPGLHAASDLAPVLFESNPIPTSSALVRRDALVAAGGFAAPAPLASDWDLWLRLVAHGRRLPVRARRTRPIPQARGRGHGRCRGAWRSRCCGCTRRIVVSWMTTPRGAPSRAISCCWRAGGFASAATPTPPPSSTARPRWRRLAPRERVLRGLVRVPGARAALGRRRPYR